MSREKKKKKRILLIDDEVAFTHLLKLNLETTGAYEVRVENWGLDGVAAVREFKPDLVLLDIVMPDIDGREVAAQIKADEILKHTPIVFFTATVLRGEVDTEGGAIDGYPFLVKPVSARNVLDSISRHLG